MIRWFAKNGIAANFLMLGILAAGIYTAMNIPLEVNPSLSWDTVMIDMPYRGATAKDVERAILIPVEQALEGVQGIDQLNADGSRGNARFWLNAKPGTDLQQLKDDVEARINTITTFPSETERPRIFIPDSAYRYEVCSVAVTGNLTPHDLLEVTRKVDADLREIPGITITDIRGDRAYEISIEADRDKLLSYNMTFQDLANAIRTNSIDLPAGAIDSDSGTFVVRTKGQAYYDSDFADIPIRASNGAEVKLGDIAEVVDGFEDREKRVIFNGKPALFIEVIRIGDESAIDISNKVREYVANSKEIFPDGIDLYVWDDDSLAIRGRLSTLVSSMFQGSLLVLVVLGLFLRPSLAFWIVIGIPVGFAGGVILMPYFGITANVMSLFGYIIVVGIVVDDAIVTAENIYAKLKDGHEPLEAAVQGTHEVATPVTFGALTTMVAFIPLMFFEGTWGDFARQVPPIVAPVLFFSLIESKLILPSHLKHLRITESRGWFASFQAKIADGLEGFISRVYQPSLVWAVRNRSVVLATFVAMALAMIGYCVGGRMGFVSFPSIDRQRITAIIRLPGTTPIEVTQRYVDRMRAAVDQLKKDFVDPGTGESLIQNVSATTGGYSPGRHYDKSVGGISVEILAPDRRSEPGPKNSEIAEAWRELVGEIDEAETFRIYAESTLDKDSEYDDQNINIELRGPNSQKKNDVARKIQKMLEGYDGISSAWARINEGQDELEMKLKPRAAELGLNQQLLAQQIRQSFYGEEAQRVQRGIDSVRAMVRLPLDDRRSLHTLDNLKIRTPRGGEVPLEEVADVEFKKAPTFVERNDRAEVLRIAGQAKDETVDLVGISKEVEPRLNELCAEAGLTYRYLGHVAEAEAAKRRTIFGAVALMFTLYGMLSIPLKSLTQPFFVMLAVPFAIIGALLGHIFMDMTPSYLSVFGMLALAGVAVNDTLVMVDYVNRRRQEGVTLLDAALEAGGKRFRPIMLTSVTTFVGLLPLMMDRSLQAQFLIPMAVSLAFGVVFATAVTLYLVPCSLLAAQDLGEAVSWLKDWYTRPFRRSPSETELIS